MSDSALYVGLSQRSVSLSSFFWPSQQYIGMLSGVLSSSAGLSHHYVDLQGLLVSVTALCFLSSSVYLSQLSVVLSTSVGLSSSVDLSKLFWSQSQLSVDLSSSLVCLSYFWSVSALC